MSREVSLSHRWVILAVCFVAMTLASGARNSFSLFYVAILNEFGWSRAGTAGILSINAIVYGLVSPLTGALVDRFGQRRVLSIGGSILALALVLCSRAHTLYHFYLAFGVVGALGISLIGFPAHAPVLSRWFIRRRGLAFGILTSGGGVSLLMIPLIQRLIEAVGWRTSFALLGIVIAGTVLPLVNLVLRQRLQDAGPLPDRSHSLQEVPSASHEIQGKAKVDKQWIYTDWTLKRALGTHQFWLVFFACFCIFGLVGTFVRVHQVALMQDAGLNINFAALIVALWGVMIVVGNLGGFLSDRIGREKTFTLGCSATAVGLIMLLVLEKSPQSWTPYAYAVSCGVGFGMTGPVLGAALADMFRGKHFGSINGFMLLGFGLGGMAGPWFGGFIFDTTGSYSAALTGAILAICAACAFLWGAAPRKIRRPW